MSIDTIKELTRRSPSKHTKTTIVDEKELNAVLRLFPRAKRDCSASGKVDMPIDRVIGLGRQGDTWQKGDTWEDVLFERLHGRGWTNAIFEYFRGSLYEKPFPTPDASGYLKLNCYHGLTVCANGNHRLAAMVCWLGATKNDKHTLKEVSTCLIPLDQKRMEYFKALYGKSTHSISVRTKELNDYQREIFETDAFQVFASGDKFYTISDEGIKLIFEINEGIFARLNRWFMPRGQELYDEKKMHLEGHRKHNEGWTVISGSTLHKLFDDAWFNSVCP